MTSPQKPSADLAPVDQRSFDIGLEAGETSMEADFQFALDDVLPFDWDGPQDLAEKLRAYLKEISG